MKLKFKYFVIGVSNECQIQKISQRNRITNRLKRSFNTHKIRWCNYIQKTYCVATLSSSNECLLLVAINGIRVIVKSSCYFCWTMMKRLINDKFCHKMKNVDGNVRCEVGVRVKIPARLKNAVVWRARIFSGKVLAGNCSENTKSWNKWYLFWNALRIKNIFQQLIT